MAVAAPAAPLRVFDEPMRPSSCRFDAAVMTKVVARLQAGDGCARLAPRPTSAPATGAVALMDAQPPVMALLPLRAHPVAAAFRRGHSLAGLGDVIKAED